MSYAMAATTAMAALIVLLPGCSRKADVRAAQEQIALESASRLRGLLGRGDCHAVYEGAGTFFQGKETREEWIAACQALRESGPWANVIAHKTISTLGANQVAVWETLAASAPHSRELISTWHFDGMTAKLSSLGYAEDRVVVIQAPGLKPVQLEETLIRVK